VEPHITVLTIGVDDLDVSLRFYRDGLAATLPDDGPSGGFFRDGKPIPW
jgi:uncharacterized protein